MKQETVYRWNRDPSEPMLQVYSHTPLGDGTYRTEVIGHLHPRTPEYDIEIFIEEYKEKLIQEQREREKKAEEERIERENLWKRKIELVEEVDRLAKAIRIFHPNYRAIISFYENYQSGASLEDYTKLRDDMKDILQGGETE